MRIKITGVTMKLKAFGQPVIFISVFSTKINAPRGCAVILIGICQLR
jgi:hypothetical protein